MLSDICQRGFPIERLEKISEPKIKKDENGFYIVSLSEGVKVYLDDFYAVLEELWERVVPLYNETQKKLAETSPDSEETTAFYRSRKLIIEIILATTKKYYTTADTLGVFMTPWCFGTVVMEKVEIVRDKIKMGEVVKHDVGDYPYYVYRYVEETYRKTLLDLFRFPPQAFSMRWQYSELLKKYTKTLANITTSLQSVLLMVRSYNS